VLFVWTTWIRTILWEFELNCDFYATTWWKMVSMRVASWTALPALVATLSGSYSEVLAFLVGLSSFAAAAAASPGASASPYVKARFSRVLPSTFRASALSQKRSASCLPSSSASVRGPEIASAIVHFTRNVSHVAHSRVRIGG
jgi:hypothetical protein